MTEPAPSWEDPQTRKLATHMLDIYEKLGFKCEEIGDEAPAEATALISAVMAAEHERDKALATAARAQSIIDALYRAGRPDPDASQPKLDAAHGLALLEKLLADDEDKNDDAGR